MTLMMTRLRSYIRQHPCLKACLLPVYFRMLHLRWLVRNLLSGRCPIAFDAGKHHLRLYPDGMISEALYGGNFEVNERDFVAAFLQPGMTVVDAGANIGLYTLISSVLVGATGRVHSFEPGRLTFDRLQRNLDLNQCQNVVANRIALSNTREQMFLRVDPTHPTLDGHRFVQSMQNVGHPASTDEIVDCQTLDDCFLSGGAGKVDFMKIDVEGAELSLLQGAEKTLAGSTDITILLECTHNRDQVRDLLVWHGFQCFVWDCVGQVLRPAIYDEVVATSNMVLRRQPWNPKL